MSLNSYSQSDDFLRANYLFGIGRFTESKALLLKSLEQKKNVEQKGVIYFQLGECERLSLDTINFQYYINCIDYSKKISQHGATRTEKANTLKRIAFSLYYTENYKYSLDWITKYLKVVPGNCEAKEFEIKLQNQLNTKG